MAYFENLQSLIDILTTDDLELMIGLQITQELLLYATSRLSAAAEADLYSLLDNPTEKEFCLQIASHLMVQRLHCMYYQEFLI